MSENKGRACAKRMDRRAFMCWCGGAACGAALLAGCGESTSAAESTAEATSTGEVACPRGITYDPYPGRCSKYRDTNGDGYCDWSEPA